MSKLQEFRIKRGISQFELAKWSDVSINSIQNYEQGRNCIDNSKLSSMIRIAEVLGVPFVDLLEDESLKKRVLFQLPAPTVQQAER